MKLLHLFAAELAELSKTSLVFVVASQQANSSRETKSFCRKNKLNNNQVSSASAPNAIMLGLVLNAASRERFPLGVPDDSYCY